MKLISYMNFLVLLSMFFFMHDLINPASGEDSIVRVQRVLTPYYDRFMEIYDEECVPSKRSIPKHLDIRLSIDKDGMEDTNHIGLCYFELDRDPNKRLLLIKRSWFNRVSEDLKYGVMFHELTHCLLDQEIHDDDPESYFNPVLSEHTKKEYEAQVRSRIARVCR